MAEAFELGATIIDILGIAGKVILACCKYQKDVDNAPKELKMILERLKGLRNVVEDIQELEAKSKNSGLSFHSLAGPLSSCLVELAGLQKRLEPKMGWKGKFGSLAWPLNDNEANKILTRLEQAKSTIQIALTAHHIKLAIDTNTNIVSIRDTMRIGFTELKESEEKALRKDIVRWLDAPDPSSNRHDALKKYQSGTCTWFISGEAFRKWMSAKSIPLWIHGIPGSGKTVLSALIDDNVKKYCSNCLDTAIADFYVDFRDERKRLPSGALRSLITQFYATLPRTPEALCLLYTQCEDDHRQPSTGELMDVFKGVLGTLKQAYIVIDALDESAEREELLDILETITGWNLDHVHILVTSRKERDIEERLGTSWHIIDMNNMLVNNDIQLRVDEVLRQDKRLSRLDSETKQEIRTILIEGADGMFRWVACQLDALRKCANLAKMRETLNSLPKTLDETYERILFNIDECYRDDALRVFQWLAYSAGPVSVQEMVEALAVDLGEDPHFEPSRRLLDPQDLFLFCSGLFNISSSDETLSFSHSTVKEYLTSDRILHSGVSFYHLESHTSNALISRICLVYLMQFDQVVKIKWDIFKTFPLTRYAAEFWIHHAKCAGDICHSDLEESIMQFLQPQSGYYNSWRLFYDLDRRSYEVTPVSFSPLYYMSLAGLERICRRLLENGAEVNTQGGWHGNALQAAVASGNGGIASMLLGYGADVNARGGPYGTALQAAVHEGHRDIIKLLLGYGADVNVQGGEYVTALHDAVLRGQGDIVQLLLGHGVDVNIQVREYGTALQLAVFQGQSDIVQLLLDRGANINVQEEEIGTVLQLAVFEGQKDIVQLLLAHGADVNIQDGGYDTPLQMAAHRDQREIVQLLLDHGADLNCNVEGWLYGTALHDAVNLGQRDIVQLLLDHGADVNMPDEENSTALQAAVYQDRKDIMQLLLDHGADANVRGEENGTILRVAAHRGQKDIGQLLLDHHADAKIQA